MMVIYQITKLSVNANLGLQEKTVDKLVNQIHGVKVGKSFVFRINSMSFSGQRSCKID